MFVTLQDVIGTIRVTEGRDYFPRDLMLFSRVLDHLCMQKFSCTSQLARYKDQPANVV
jgi:hypothetical protein